MLMKFFKIINDSSFIWIADAVPLNYNFFSPFNSFLNKDFRRIKRNTHNSILFRFEIIKNWQLIFNSYHNKIFNWKLNFFLYAWFLI